MQFLKTLFWVVLAVAAVVFAMRNWNPVDVALWGGFEVETKLPVLLYGAFLAGLLPTYVWHRAHRWRLNRRIGDKDRALAEIRASEVGVPVVEPAADPVLVPPAQS